MPSQILSASDRRPFLLAIVIGLVIFIFWLQRDSAGFIQRTRVNRRSTERGMPAPAAPDELFALAEKTIIETIESLPEDLKREASKVEWVLRDWVSGGPLWILGHYFGFRPGIISDYQGPIILYIAAIQRFCIKHGFDFQEQVQKTYLHELGHHLGLDEADLEKRGLR